MREETPLERWKALARIENARARKVWSGRAVKYAQWSRTFIPEGNETRKRRNEIIVDLSASGLSIGEIGRRVGLGNAAVATILREHRLAVQSAEVSR